MAREHVDLDARSSRARQWVMEVIVGSRVRTRR